MSNNNFYDNDELNKRLLRVLIMGVLLYLYLNYKSIISQKEIINTIIITLTIFMLIDTYIPRVVVI